MGESPEAARRRSGARRARASARRWPLDGASPETDASSRSIGELTIVQLGGRPALRCPALPGSRQAGRSRLALLALTDGECAFRGGDGRLAPMRRGEVLVAACVRPLELK